MVEKEIIDPTEQKSTETFRQKIIRMLPILITLPLMVLLNADAALLLVNQVLVIAEFELQENFSILGTGMMLSQITKAIFILVFGFYSDKTSRKKLLIIGGLAWGLGNTLCYFSPNVGFLIFFRLIASIGAGGCTPAIMSFLGDIFPAEKRGKAFAWWGFATTIGALGGGVITLAYNKIDYNFSDTTISLEDRLNYIINNYPVDILNQWRIPFLLMGVLGLIFAALILLIKEPKRGSADGIGTTADGDTIIDYTTQYYFKKDDLKVMWERKSNFWLIINFADCVLSGFLVANLITWLTLEINMDISSPSALIPFLPFILMLVVGLMYGQFYWPKKGDKKIKEGDPAGRVKIAVYCGIIHVPLLVVALLFFPNKGNNSFLHNNVMISSNGSWFAIFTIMGIILSLGVFTLMGVGPNWFASMMDVNVPENRGSMIAAATFMDAIGRGIGMGMGAWMVDYYTRKGSSLPMSDSILLMSIVWGILSSLAWYPVLKHCEKDFNDVADIIEERKKSFTSVKISYKYLESLKIFKNLISIADKIEISKAAELMKIPEKQMHEYLLEWKNYLQFKIENNFIVISDVDSFIDSLDALYAEWENNESTKSEKR